MDEDAFIGEIRIFPYGFVPRGWLACEGQSLPVSQNTGLFSLIMNTYGGDHVNFKLPDLRSAVAIGAGSGPGLTPVDLGDQFGQTSVTLGNDDTPAHNHSLQRKGATAVTQKTNVVGANTNLGQLAAILTPPLPASQLVPHMTTAAPNTALSPRSIGMAGQGQPHENRQPYLAMVYAICVQGIYPQRS